MSDDAITSAIESSIADLDSFEESASASAIDTESASATADVADGSADIEDGHERAEQTEPAQQTQPAELTPEQKRADELLKGEFKGNKNNRVPYTRVAKISEKAFTDGRAAAEQEFTPKIQAYEQQLASYGNTEKAMRLAHDNPEAFLSLLAQHDQRYAQILGGLQPPTNGRRESPQPAADMPQPDLKLDDGTLLYSAEQARKLSEWQVQHQFAEMQQRAVQQRQAEEQMYAASYRKVMPRYEAIQKLPEFEAHRQAIYEAMLADPKLEPEVAYMRIVQPKLAAQREAIAKEERAKVLAEMQKRPRTASSLAPASRAASEHAGPREMEDVINEALAAAGLE